MKLTATVKLISTPEQAQALKETLERANEACNFISQLAWENQVWGQFSLQKLCYYEVRSTFDLSAQMTVRILAKVSDAYKLDRKTRREFSCHGSIAYDSRILKWKLNKHLVSIWTLGGRTEIPFICGERQWQLLQTQQGESDLVLMDGVFYLFATCEVEDPKPEDVSDVLGIDLGIVNIAVDSDGESFSGGQVNGLRKRHAKLRARLQKKGARSAKRLLKKRKRKESRFVRNVNHAISKKLVAKAKRTGKVIALENLKGIRSRIRVRRPQRRSQHSWAFFQLRSFVEYKARLEGVPIVFIDPAYTSQECPVCHNIDKRNRPSQSRFSCIQCGFDGLADAIAASNIAARGRVAVNQPYVATVRS